MILSSWLSSLKATKARRRFGKRIRSSAKRKRIGTSWFNKPIHTAEVLEDRTLLTAHPLNVFADFDGEIASSEASSTVTIHLTSENFEIGSGQTTLGFEVFPAEGSDFIAAPVTVTSHGSGGVPVILESELSDGRSLVLAKLKHGDYDIQITGVDGSVGAWDLHVFLAGDVNGDFVVDTTDRDLINDVLNGTITDPDFFEEADSNRDGEITGFDLARASGNKGASTSVRILTISTELDSASDTGILGDSLVNQTPIEIVGLTLAGAEVLLDEDSDGFDDGSTIATNDVDTNYSLTSNLIPGSNTLVVEARDSFGQTAQASTVVTLDNVPPTVVATIPAQNAEVEAVPGVNDSVSIDFSEPMIGSNVLGALSVTGDASGTITPLDVQYDNTTSTLSFELSSTLTDTNITVNVADTATDLAGNSLSGAPFSLDFTINRVTTITDTSPANGEEMVSTTREAIVRFSREIDPTTITGDSFKLIALGSEVAGRRVVSSTNRFVTFFPDEPWNPSTEIRLIVDGDQILDETGKAVDADGDGEPGGVFTADFRTLPLTRIPGTNVFGFVRDSFTGEPIVGATIRVDAIPGANVVTDGTGRFQLNNMPAPEFFVHVDGSTAINTPAGFVYPNVGKPFHSVPGQTVQIEMNREPFDIFLPPMALGDVQPLSATEPTEVGFGDAGKSNLVEMFPDVDSSMFDLMKVTFAPGAAVDDFGNAATEASIIPVPPDRIPAPLPPTLNPSLVISIQAGGATNFDIPAEVTFPNLDGLAPGEVTLIFSFDHDAGEWIVIGTGTVSEDGLAIVSDPGVGILAPGWHLVQVGTNTTTGALVPCTSTVCATFEGKHGDVIQVDLSGTVVLSERAPASHEFKILELNEGKAAKNKDGTEISKQVTINYKKPDGTSAGFSGTFNTFKDGGLFYVVPEITQSSTSPTNNPTPKTITGRFETKLFRADPSKPGEVFEGVIRIDVMPEFSTSGDEAVPTSTLQPADSGATRLEIYRAQQRLRYLGFHAPRRNDGKLLEVDGGFGSLSQHAISVFNAAVTPNVNSGVNVASKTDLNTFINASNAPRWVKTSAGGPGWVNADLPDTNPHGFGTSWAIEVIQEAGQRNTSSKLIAVNDLSNKGGGDTTDHGTHEAGMDIDVRIGPAGAGLWYDISTANANLNSTSTFWATVANEDPSDSISSASIARANVAVGGDFTTGYTGSSANEANGWRLDQTLLNIYGHRGTGDAYDTAIQDIALAQGPPPNPDPQVLFDVGFDLLAGKRSTYDRDATVAHIAAFETTKVSRVIFNEPHARRLVQSVGPLPFAFTTLAVHGNHFHVDVKPPTATFSHHSHLSESSASSISTAPGFGTDDRLYYRLELANGFQLAGRTNNEGQFSEILTPNIDYVVAFYQASTNRSAVYRGQSNASGQLTDLGLILLTDFGGEDSDGDGIPDVGEFAIGTSPTATDTDDDGITDDAEITQGLDPLDDRGFPTGVISSLPLPGFARDVVVEENIAYVATGSHGLAIVDVSRFNNPILLGQLDLPGTATDVDVDPALGRAAVTTNLGGLAIVDVSDPMMPEVAHVTTNVLGSRVEVFDGVAYVSVGGSLTSVDLLTGGILETISLGGTITDIAREGSFLYTMNTSRQLRVIDITGGNMVARGSVFLAHGAGKLFVGNGVAYVAARTNSSGGYSTVDVSNPDNPTLISNSDVPSGFFVPRDTLAVNGSGLAIAAGASPSGPSFNIMDSSDLTNTNSQLLRFNLPSNPTAVQIASGIAFVAEGIGGLQVINYLPFDNRGQAPTVTISTSAVDVDPDTEGIQVVEGTSIPIQANVTEDVQVRNVELIVNGEVVRNDVSFPFDFSAIALSDDPEAMVTTVQVRATDTGGNVALSNTLTIDLVPDTFPPTIVSVDPANGTIRPQGHRTVRVRFSESIDAVGVTSDKFTIVEAGADTVFGTSDDVPVSVTNIQLRSDDRLVQLTTNALGVGFYRIGIQQDAITDRAGNALGAGIFTSDFEVVEAIPITITFNAGFGTPFSYSESGMTIVSRQTHLHMSANLLNHSGCCSTPYQFDFEGGGSVLRGECRRDQQF